MGETPEDSVEGGVSGGVAGGFDVCQGFGGSGEPAEMVTRESVLVFEGTGRVGGA